MATTTFKFDENTEAMIEELKASFGVSTKAEVFRMALGVLDMIDHALEEGQELAFVDHDTNAKGIRRITIASPAGSRRSKRKNTEPIENGSPMET